MSEEEREIERVGERKRFKIKSIVCQCSFGFHIILPKKKKKKKREKNN